ncbi:phosphotransferase family protein [Streptomyces massasporeus]
MGVHEEDATPGLDLARLRPWFTETVPTARAGMLTATLITGGKSNLTYRLTDGASHWILRRPPLGHILATAHDMGREYAVMAALADTPVPVPAMHGLCLDTGVLGAEFYVMEAVPGRPYRTAADLKPLGPHRVRRISGALVDTLADLHTVDPDAVGLGGFGRPEGFLTRQVARWRHQLGRPAHRQGGRHRRPGVDRHGRGQGQLPGRAPAGPGGARLRQEADARRLSRRGRRSPGRRVGRPSGHQATRPPGRRAAGPGGHQVTRLPGRAGRPGDRWARRPARRPARRGPRTAPRRGTGRGTRIGTRPDR